MFRKVAFRLGVRLLRKEDSLPSLMKSSESRPVLAWLTASWCGPCKQVAPLVDRLSEKSPGIDIIKIDIDDFPAIAEDLEISSVPTFIMFENKAVVARVIGANGSKIEEMTAKYK